MRAGPTSLVRSCAQCLAQEMPLHPPTEQNLLDELMNSYRPPGFLMLADFHILSLGNRKLGFFRKNLALTLK